MRDMENRLRPEIYKLIHSGNIAPFSETAGMVVAIEPETCPREARLW